jgi:hypothetical protein
VSAGGGGVRAPAARCAAPDAAAAAQCTTRCCRCCRCDLMGCPEDACRERPVAAHWARTVAASAATRAVTSLRHCCCCCPRRCHARDVRVGRGGFSGTAAKERAAFTPATSIAHQAAWRACGCEARSASPLQCAHCGAPAASDTMLQSAAGRSCRRRARAHLLLRRAGCAGAAAGAEQQRLRRRCRNSTGGAVHPAGPGTSRRSMKQMQKRSRTRQRRCRGSTGRAPG